MALLKSFARNLKSRRIMAEMSQEALAHKAGFSTSYVSMLEQAKRSPPLDTVEALAKVLKVAPTSLLA